MTLMIRNIDQKNCLLPNTALVSKELDKTTLEAIKSLKSLATYLPSTSLGYKRIKRRCNAIYFYITTIAISRSLFFREMKKTALISGAGIAGLAASLELRARDFSVVVVEQRREFSRFNVINLSVETQIFLRKFKLLEQFERFVAARIKEHRYVVIEKNKSAVRLPTSDVSHLQLDESISLEPENFNKLFDQDGIYSVPIRVLQEFLAERALEAGVKIYGNTTASILSRTHAGGVAKVQITVDRTLKPELFFIAEGSHSKTALQLGMKKKTVKNVCTGENWIFGNMTYSGKETFVISLIDASEKTLRIANVIFNAKSHVINIAVTSDKALHEDSIREEILRTAHQIFDQNAFPIEKMECTLLTTVRKPVRVVNQITSPFSRGNIFCIGDSAGSSSPLAGLGGTLGLTLVPLTIGQLLRDYELQSSQLHENFYRFSEACTARWVQKSENIKKFCISILEKQQYSS